MKPIAIRTVQALVTPTVALAIVLLLAPGRAELAIHVYVLVLLAIALAAAVAAISSSQGSPPPSAFEAGLRHPVEVRERLAELAQLERATDLATTSAFDLHFRLRPVLREIAAGLLAVRHGVDLDRRPEQSRALLGEETWELVRPDHAPPGDRFAPGIQPRALERTVAVLEAL